MEAFGLGELELSVKAFWRMSWREYLTRAGAYHHRQVLDWQRTRWLATAVYNAQRTDADELVEPEQLLWLPGDPMPPALPTLEEYAVAEARLLLLDADLL